MDPALGSARAGKGPRTALVASVHIAPSDVALKNSAVAKTRRALDIAHRKAPQDLVVVAGDFNLTRCKRLPSEPETKTCAVRHGHRSLQEAGDTDAVRSQHLTGPTGVVGVGRRIDFLNTKASVDSSWFDRCYQAYYVKRFRCERGRWYSDKRDCSLPAIAVPGCSVAPETAAHLVPTTATTRTTRSSSPPSDSRPGMLASGHRPLGERPARGTARPGNAVRRSLCSSSTT